MTDTSGWSAGKRRRLSAMLPNAATDTLSDEQRDTLKAIIIRSIKNGATLSEVCQFKDMPTRDIVTDWTLSDPQFATDLDAARVQCAQASVDDAMDVMRDVSEDESDDLRDRALRARIAEAVHRTSLAYAAALSPRTHGQLVRLGQAAELEPIQLQVVSYAVDTATAPKAVAAAHYILTDNKADQSGDVPRNEAPTS